MRRNAARAAAASRSIVVAPVADRARRGAAERGLERRRRVDLERPQRDARQPELRLDHLALLGDAQRAVDRTGRLRLDREVRRPAAAADAAAAPVEERDGARRAGAHASTIDSCALYSSHAAASRPTSFAESE